LLLLTCGSNIIIIQQSYIRRYLAKKKIIKMKKQCCFDIILSSIPQYIEYNKFKCFNGGYEYLELANKYAEIEKKKMCEYK
jgi:hypothetical protein